MEKDDDNDDEPRRYLRDRHLEKYERTFKWLAARNRQERQEGRIEGDELLESEFCRANRVDIVEDNLWMWEQR